ncbi:histidine kinase [candidate division KSB1 bacterium]|nr:histidine kinase [candidate division KSB1 bacterium]
MDYELAQLIREHKQEIVNDWVELIRKLPDSRYPERPISELHASTMAALLAVVKVFEDNNYEQLWQEITKVAEIRLQMGFDMGEVISVLLLFKEAVLPYLIEHYLADQDALTAILTKIDFNSRWTVRTFSDIFSQNYQKRSEITMAELREHQHRLRQQKKTLKREVEEKESLISSVGAIVSTLDHEKVLDYIVVQACKLMGTKQGIIFEIDENNKDLVLLAGRGLSTTDLRSGAYPIAIRNDLMNLIVTSNVPVCIPDIRTYSELKDEAIIKRLLDSKICALLAVHLISQKEVLGGIAVFDDAPHEFSKDEQKLLDTFSIHAALAIENARAYRSSHKTAILMERNRLAREIHDNLAQGLTAIVLQLELIDKLLTKNPDRVKTEIEKAKNQARRNLDEARRSVWDLRAGADELLALPETIRLEIEKFKLMGETEIHFRLEGLPVDLIPEASNHIFRIFQESLNNVFQHARAKNVWIHLKFNPDVLNLDVIDDGIGLQSLRGKLVAAQKGFGLVGMQERGRLLKGNVTINSSEKDGTTVSLTVPLKDWIPRPSQISDQV